VAQLVDQAEDEADAEAADVGGGDHAVILSLSMA
jgi:hypothetical protein